MVDGEIEGGVSGECGIGREVELWVADVGGRGVEVSLTLSEGR